MFKFSSPDSLIFLIKSLVDHLSPRRRIQYLLLLVGMIVGAILEVVSLGAVLPFLGIMTTPEIFFENKYTVLVLKSFDFINEDNLIFYLSVTFGSIVFLSSAFRVFITWLNAKIAFLSGSDLSVEVYEKTLYQPYSVHITRNSSDVISSITLKVDKVVLSVILPSLIVLTNLIIGIFISCALITLNVEIAALSTVSFVMLYLIVSLTVKKRVRANSQCVSEKQPKVVKALQEGLGGIRDVILVDAQKIYSEEYKKSDLPLREAQGNNIFLGMCPRYIIEGFAMIGIISYAYFLSQEDGGVARALPMLGALVVGAQRLLPSMQQVYGSWTTIAGSRDCLIDVLELLEQRIEKDMTFSSTERLVEFKSEILFDNVSYHYDGSEEAVLSNVSFKISKGDVVGIVGPTGCGKSTILDLLMRLIVPTSGAIYVDGKKLDDSLTKSWREGLSHVSQNIFISDSSMAQNIAFGEREDRIDLSRVRDASLKSLISEFWEESNLKKPLGENGGKLSGGQKQRVGIARAIYRNPDLLILDEATSALDNATEKKVIDSIHSIGSGKTILMVAHRLSTLSGCTKILEMEKGKVKREVSYEELVQ